MNSRRSSAWHPLVPRWMSEMKAVRQRTVGLVSSIAAPNGIKTPRASAESVTVGRRPALSLGVQRVAGRADGADQVRAVRLAQRLAQAAHVDVHGADLDIGIGAPDGVQQALAAEHPARALHQEIQQ